MTGRASPLPDGTRSPRVLAFYLPQFHPTPETDQWWGQGFTEWRQVAKAKPLFPGHYQPHVPADLGYYDLRVDEVREQQSALAREHGIYGFCYYHYWFHGRRLLARPFEEVLASGSPEFPFALCWANETWTRNGDGRTGQLLVAQQHSDADDLAHIRWLGNAFADDRYVKIDGRPLMLVYRAEFLPDARRTADLWRSQAQQLGFPDLYLARVESHGHHDDPASVGFDANVGFLPKQMARALDEAAGSARHTAMDYDSMVAEELEVPAEPYRRFPAVLCSWDNTPRPSEGAVMFANSSPQSYEKWLRHTVASVSAVRAEENFIFVIAWNGWAEGNHLEPDERYGRGWLEATARALSGGAGAASASGDRRQSSYNYFYDYDPSGALGHAVTMAGAIADRTGLVVDLGAGGAAISHPLRSLGFGYHGLETHAEALESMAGSGIAATKCDLADVDAVVTVLDGLEHVALILMLDVIEHLIEPQDLLSRLSQWALAKGSPYLIVSVPNVAHFDLGIRLLLGHWDPTDVGLLDSTHVRFFTGRTLERMLARCGWKVVERSNHEVACSDQPAPDPLDGLPESVVGVLRFLSGSFNPFGKVYQFVWTLAPVEMDDPPTSFLDALGRPDARRLDRLLDLPTAASVTEGLGIYTDSAGIVSAATHRRLREEVRAARRSLALLALVSAGGQEIRADPTMMVALRALADTYAARPDWQRSFQTEEGVDIAGLVDWAVSGGPPDDPDVRALRVHHRRLHEVRLVIGHR